MAKTQPIYSTSGIYQCTAPNWKPLQLVLHEDDVRARQHDEEV